MELLINVKNADFSLISSTVSGLLVELQIELPALLTILRVFELQHLIYSSLSAEFDLLVFCTNSSLIEFNIRYLALFCHYSLMEGFKWFWMERLQEYPVKTDISQGSLFGPILLLLYIDDLSDGVICNIAISADDTTFSCTYYQASDLRHQLELASNLTYKALWIRRVSGLWISILKKFDLFNLASLIALMLLM